MTEKLEVNGSQTVHQLKVGEASALRLSVDRLVVKQRFPSEFTNGGVFGPQNDGWALEKATGPFKNGNFLVSTLDFWGVFFEARSRRHPTSVLESWGTAAAVELEDMLC